jgi:D-alanyl-lipoteichoic acid acyltransferase DltB (MBOAT superfamily)
LELLVGTIFYSYYAYADFAGYSLIAIGSALLFGIELSQNFRQPLLSTDVLEFWRSWHITFFLWLRDYIFTPLHLTFRRMGQLGLALALLLTLVFSGFWHGVSLNYVCYALMQAVFIIFAVVTTPLRTVFWNRLSIPQWLHLPFKILTTNILIVIGFMMFATPTLSDAFTVYGKVFSLELFGDLHNLRSFASDGQKASAGFLAYAPWIALLFAGDVWVRCGLEAKLGTRMNKIGETMFYNACILVIIYSYWKHSGVTPFLYAGF